MDIITTENTTFEEMYKFNGICREAFKSIILIKCLHNLKSLSCKQQ